MLKIGLSIAGMLVCLILIIIAAILIKKKTKTEELKNDSQSVKNKIWSSKNKTTVQIPKFNYYEIYDKFPFNSEFIATKEYLIKKNNLEFEEINLIIKTLKQLQFEFYSNWSIVNHEILIKNKNPYNYKILLNFYKDKITEEFSKQIIPLVIDNHEDEARKILINIFDELKNIYKQIHQKKISSQKFEEDEDIEVRDPILEAFLILEMNETNDLELIKKQYKKMAKKYHPDINKHKNANEKMSMINEAYTLIKTIKKI
ncbi:DnaJ domain-containing protein [Mesoplasma photuris]|uniref:DnaJ domain-containing protein n=1 Tax=Mesoplasma photuris TaxID=217731 RepID=UPI0004E0C2B8|nr:DnaJ domain-containing protein [Mesoplasma photuris]